MTRKAGILIVRMIVGLLVIAAVLLLPAIVACTKSKIVDVENNGVDTTIIYGDCEPQTDGLCLETCR